MKKSIYFLFALCILAAVSCKHPNTNKDAKMTEDELMAKEKKSLVQEKKYVSDKEHWEVSLTSKLKDTRTIEEVLKDIPRKEDIVNTVAFDGRFMAFKSIEDMYYKVYLELEKVIKYSTKKVVFVLKPKLLTQNIIEITKNNPIQIKFSHDDIVNIPNVNVTYKKNEDRLFQYLDVKDTIMEVELSIAMINRLRTAQSNVTIVFNAINDTFILPLPSIFIEYLKEF